ncbi:MAG TPA: DUF177 domain-containing protein [Bacteroidota bacterium]|nr:DUF177 domain-containing protein [Bacteroidota bacterium]
MTSETSGEKGLKIRISGLSNGFHEYHFSAEPPEIGLDGNFRPPVTVDVQLDKTTRQILLRADISTTGEFECDRCLDPFQLDLRTGYTLVYLYDESDAARYNEEEVQIIAPDTVTIDVAEDVRQMVMLSVPLKLLCREECRGLCPVCGVNRNRESCACSEQKRDPRWDALNGLLNT